MSTYFKSLIMTKMYTAFSYAHTEIRTQVVVICDPTRYQLDHGGAPIFF